MLSILPEAPMTAPGGSAGNTVFALNRLGVRAELLGKIGDDAHGRFYLERMRSAGGSGEYLFSAPEAGTGTCLALTTPDGERTMRSYLGASLELTDAELAKVDFGAFSTVLIEGYMIGCPVFAAVLEKARTAKCVIAFDPGSFELIHRHRESLAEVANNSNMLFVNRAEAEALTGERPPEKLAEELNRRCPCVVLKLGADGALIKRGGEPAVRIPAFRVDRPVDTTAAGDMFAAGFFFGLGSRRSWSECGKLGARLAAEVVKVSGTELPDATWREIESAFAVRTE